MRQFIKILNMDNAIGKRIELIIKRKHLTQEAFANRIKTSRPTVGKWIGGTIAPSYDMIFNIISAFDDIDGYWFITGEGQMEKAKIDYMVAEPVAVYSKIEDNNIKDLLLAKDKIINDKDDEIKFLRELLREKK